MTWLFGYVKSADRMVLEVAILSVRSGQGPAFEAAFAKARALISAMPGFISLDLQKSLAVPERYLLLVEWQQIEDHTEGFRKSSSYGDWSRLLHHFYEPFPTVEYFGPIERVQRSAERLS